MSDPPRAAGPFDDGDRPMSMSDMTPYSQAMIARSANRMEPEAVVQRARCP